MQALMPRLVETPLFPRAAALSAASIEGAFIVGPALGGFLTQLSQIGLGAGWMISDYEQLGRITHADALQMRKNDRTRLASELASMKTTDEGYRQKQDELTELDKNIKSATDQFQGQFNIGGIKLPTVYEIRRSLGVTDGGNTSAVNNYSTAAHVTINGADFARVVSYINSILGKPTRNVRANSTRVVG